MILKRIVEFAEKHVQDQPSGYQPRFITKVIQLDGQGNVRNVIALTGQSRGKREGLTRPEPQESPARTVAIKPRLISDNVNYVLGRPREKDTDRQAADRHSAWVAQLTKAATEVCEPSLEAVARWAEAGGPAKLRDDPRIVEDDDITFEVEGVYPTDLPAVRRYWAGIGTETRRGTCLITGCNGPLVDRMPSPIKGVPDGQMSGTALISVNNAAGESYGLSAALNSPVSTDAAEKLCNGLNYLINTRAGDRAKYALRVGKAVYIAWCREDTPFDLWSMLDKPDPAHVQQTISQAYTGHRPSTAKSSDFYVMALSANMARIVVRDYHETTLEHVQANLARWFKRLEIAGTDGGTTMAFGVYRLAASLYRDANKEMPPHVPTALIASAITARPVPEYLLGLAIKRNLAMQGPFTLTQARTKTISVSRLALIKALLTESPEDSTLTQLNLGQKNPAYHCGRLLAVLESIQRMAALPSKLNSTLVDRNYGAACASPASIFGNLLKDATRAHLPKLRKNRPGAYIALDQSLQEIATSVGDEFPATLTLRDQGLFALGFYHQRAHDFGEARRRSDLKELADQTISEETNVE